MSLAYTSRILINKCLIIIITGAYYYQPLINLARTLINQTIISIQIYYPSSLNPYCIATRKQTVNILLDDNIMSALNGNLVNTEDNDDNNDDLPAIGNSTTGTKEIAMDVDNSI